MPAPGARFHCEHNSNQITAFSNQAIEALSEKNGAGNASRGRRQRQRLEEVTAAVHLDQLGAGLGRCFAAMRISGPGKPKKSRHCSQFSLGWAGDLLDHYGLKTD